MYVIPTGIDYPAFILYMLSPPHAPDIFMLTQDRPHTLEWIIKYNIWPGEMMIVFFAHLFASSEQRDLVYILVFVTGVGDGLAEPVNVILILVIMQTLVALWLAVIGDGGVGHTQKYRWGI